MPEVRKGNKKVVLMHDDTNLFSNPASLHLEDVQIKLMCMPANIMSLIQPLGFDVFPFLEHLWRIILDYILVKELNIYVMTRNWPLSVCIS